MISSRSARMLARYNAWADKVLFEAIVGLPADEAQNGPPPWFKPMLQQLNHIYLVDLIWQAHLEQRGHGFTRRDIVLHPDLDNLWEAQQAASDWFVTWADSQSEPRLDEEIHFTLTEGNKGVMSRGEILLHVVNHHTYHRGRISGLFSQVPCPPPAMDLPVFRREMPVDMPAL